MSGNLKYRNARNSILDILKNARMLDILFMAYHIKSGKRNIKKKQAFNKKKYLIQRNNLINKLLQ